jgi:heme a synthase
VNAPAAYDLSPIGAVALVGGLLALGPLLWVCLRQGRSAAVDSGARRLQALTVVTLFLTFDLVLFGAFTRLTDSGLGCPDWPGCYGSASPLGAQAQIQSAQSVLPSGPVTHGKAWVEMIHRYLATGVGALVTVIAVLSWFEARKRSKVPSPWWATATLVWVCLQGAFGALTVTMKLYPAIVTLHLLGGLGLLALLAVQTRMHEPPRLSLAPALHAGVWVVAVLSVVQIALGGWVSTNYAVLVCSDFPTCQGVWWPPMDVEQGFALQRELGAGKDGGYLPFAALTAIHFAHRLGALVLLSALALLAWRLFASGHAALRSWALAVAAVALWQLASGLSNVVLGWPIVAAMAHTAGAAALVTLLAVLLTQARTTPQSTRATPAPARPWRAAT